jgi:ribosomal protein S18 acetylase RimI-like enzyme
MRDDTRVVACPEHRSNPMLAQNSQVVHYSPAAPSDIEQAAAIYLRHFRHRTLRWFPDPARARRFYCDFFELMLLAYPESFLVARVGTRIAGYAILKLPQRWAAATFRRGFILRAAAHAVTGSYGSPWRWIPQCFDALFGRAESPRFRQLLKDNPHLSVIAVDSGYIGMGIGSALLREAAAVCRPRFGRITLLVEHDNPAAIRLYERMGFRIEASERGRHLMVLSLS